VVFKLSADWMKIILQNAGVIQAFLVSGSPVFAINGLIR
jgi:hypothetical protein